MDMIHREEFKQFQLFVLNLLDILLIEVDMLFGNDIKLKRSDVMPLHNPNVDDLRNKVVSMRNGLMLRKRAEELGSQKGLR